VIVQRAQPWLLLGTLVLLAPACAKPAEKEEAAPETEAILEVDNRGFYDMTIYVVRSSTRLRIGIAPGLKVTTFSLKRHIIGQGSDLQFMADPIGGNRTPVSQRMYVSPGEIVHLTISP
jgi:hypothetical protein